MISVESGWIGFFSHLVALFGLRTIYENDQKSTFRAGDSSSFKAPQNCPISAWKPVFLKNFLNLNLKSARNITETPV